MEISLYPLPTPTTGKIKHTGILYKFLPFQVISTFSMLKVMFCFPLWLPLLTKRITFKHVKYMNPFIIARLQRKRKKSSENPHSGSQVLGLIFGVSCLTRVPGRIYEIGPGPHVLGPRSPSRRCAPGLRSRVPP